MKQRFISSIASPILASAAACSRREAETARRDRYRSRSRGRAEGRAGADPRDRQRQPVSDRCRSARSSAGSSTRVWFREGDEVGAGSCSSRSIRVPIRRRWRRRRRTWRATRRSCSNAEAEPKRYARPGEEGLRDAARTTTSIIAGAEAARAVVAADRAAVENAQLQLAYCEIRSPHRRPHRQPAGARGQPRQARTTRRRSSSSIRCSR